MTKNGVVTYFFFALNFSLKLAINKCKSKEERKDYFWSTAENSS